MEIEQMQIKLKTISIIKRWIKRINENFTLKKLLRIKRTFRKAKNTGEIIRTLSVGVGIWG